MCPPGFRTQLHVTTSLSTGEGLVSCVRLSEAGSRWFTLLACGPGHPELSKSYSDMASKWIVYIEIYSLCPPYKPHHDIHMGTAPPASQCMPRTCEMTSPLWRCISACNLSADTNSSCIAQLQRTNAPPGNAATLSGNVPGPKAVHELHRLLGHAHAHLHQYSLEVLYIANRYYDSDINRAKTHIISPSPRHPTKCIKNV